MRPDDAALLDILTAAQLCVRFTTGYNRVDFEADLKTQSAVLHQLLVLGEAARRLSPEFRAQQPVAPWQRIVGLRNVLIHAYDSVDLDEVWRIVQRDIPGLIQAITPLVPPEP